MAIGSFDSRRHQGPMAEINVVPLVDVMLVLLVIFIITAPLLTNAVKIDLPKASSNPNITKPDHIEFGIREMEAFIGPAKRLRLHPWRVASQQKLKNSPSRNYIFVQINWLTTNWWHKSCLLLPKQG